MDLHLLAAHQQAAHHRLLRALVSPHKPPPIPKGIPDNSLYHAYYYFILPVAVTLSFLSATTILRRILRRKPRGIFTKEEEDPECPRSAVGLACQTDSQQFFDTLVFVLSAIQTYLFGAWFCFLPIFYIFPGIPLIGRLDSSWLYRPDPDPIRNALCLANYALILPAIWVQIGWHSVIAYVLHAFIAQRQPLPSLHRRLKPAFLIVLVGVVVKTVLEQLGYFYHPLASMQYYSFLVFNALVTVFIAFMYGTSLFALACGGPAMGPSTRAIRDRLLLICSYIMLVLATRAVMVGLGISAHRPPLEYQIFCNFVWLLWGFFDSIFLGKLCGKVCGGHVEAKRRVMRRQTTDDRVRMGVSAIGVPARSFFTGLYSQYNGSSAAVTLRQPLEPSMVEMEGVSTDTAVIYGGSFDSITETKTDPVIMVSGDDKASEQHAMSYSTELPVPVSLTKFHPQCALDRRPAICSEV